MAYQVHPADEWVEPRSFWLAWMGFSLVGLADSAHGWQYTRARDEWFRESRQFADLPGWLEAWLDRDNAPPVA